MGASKERADAIRELLMLASDELGRRAASLISRPQPDSGAVTQALDHIHTHSDKPIAMQELTAVAGVSRQHLAKIWKQQVGVPLNGYLNAIRIERAKILLESGRQKVIDVAMACGFGSLSQFNRAFLRATGVSPTRWIARRR
jgi:AraC-like DNA-binding protein